MTRTTQESHRPNPVVERLLRFACGTASVLFYGNRRNGDWIYEKMHRPSSYAYEIMNLLLHAGKRPRVHRLLSLIIEPVFGCNLHCSYCWHAIDTYFEYKAKRPRLMDMALFRKAIDEAPSSVESVAFGLIGEPLLHPEIDDMIRYANDKGFRTVLYTNGTLLSEAMCTRLANTPLTVLSVSVEPDEENSLKHRGVSTHLLRKNIERFFDMKPEMTEIKLSVVVHHDNVSFIDSLEENWSKLIHNIKLSPVIRYNGTRLPNRCIEPWRGSLCILTDGQVSPCCVSAGYKPITIGNLATTPLNAIFQSQRFRSVLSNMTHGTYPEVCRRCNEFNAKHIPMRIPGNTR